MKEQYHFFIVGNILNIC